MSNRLSKPFSKQSILNILRLIKKDGAINKLSSLSYQRLCAVIFFLELELENPELIEVKPAK